MEKIEYRCAVCDKLIRSTWTDEEARAEADQHFHGADTVIVCSSCYRRATGRP